MTCMGIARIVLVKRRSVQVALVLPSLLLASGNLIQPLCLLWLCITIQGFNYNAQTSSRLFLLFPISLISCYSCLSAFISFPFHSSWLSTVSPHVLLCSTLFLSVISAPSWPSVVASIFVFLYFLCFFLALQALRRFLAPLFLPVLLSATLFLCVVLCSYPSTLVSFSTFLFPISST